MDRETQFASEVHALRALCDEATPREERKKLARALIDRVFVESQHQVVLESIRALLSRGPISAERLRVHLNNRGFPDTDVEQYFPPAPNESIRSQTTRTGKP